MMNYAAHQLGTTDTDFDNPDGLPDKNNYTSAYDMALISIKAISTPEELKYFGAVDHLIPADNVRSTPCEFGTIVNILRPNSMYYYNGIIAAKSGWIDMSGYTLVTAAQRDDRTLVCVQMGGESWGSVYDDAAALFNYGFAQPETISTDAAFSPMISVQPVKINKENFMAVKSIETKGIFKSGIYKISVFMAALICLAACAVICFNIIERRIRKKRERNRV